jgi:multidrug efflux pump subunit AcrA (membrane-fusion protein)
MVIICAIIVVNNKRQKKSVIQTVIKGPITQSVYGIGTVVADRSFQYKVGVTARITKLLATEGDVVKKDQVVIVIDGEVPFKAPFSGTVSAVNFKEGETVFQNSPILTLVDQSHLYIEVSLEQQGALAIDKKSKTIFQFESLKDQVFNGDIQSIYTRNKEFIVKIVPQKMSSKILPGMTADVAFILAEKPNALLVPSSSIQNGQVTVLEGRRKKKVPVKVGWVDAEKTEIIEGDLKENDQIILSE